MITKERTRTGTQDIVPREYETAHRRQAREIAAGGIVLLKNEEGILPISTDTPIAVYGPGAYQTIIGGTGSGQVNVREKVSVLEGLKNAGYKITNENWLKQAEQKYEDARMSYKKAVLDMVDATPKEVPFRTRYHKAYNAIPFIPPVGDLPEKTDAEIAVYVISRNAGEGQDRFDREGDYRLTEMEEETIRTLCELYTHIVLVINAGGMVDLSILDQCPKIHGVLFMHQPGMEAGNALADVISGKIPACGKLADTWAYAYKDYPASATFSHNNGILEYEMYNEGIYVGYRYFDSFEVPVRYSFGFGLTYSEFTIETKKISFENPESDSPKVCVQVEVTNSGTEYSGKEVVQVYAACPQTTLEKEYRKLVGFEKTDLLAPGESQTLKIEIPLYAMTSFDEELPGWILDAGTYGLFVGSSLEAARPAAAIRVEERVDWVKTEHNCPPEKVIETISPSRQRINARRNEWEAGIDAEFCIELKKGAITPREIKYDEAAGEASDKAKAFVETLTEDEQIELVKGEITSSKADVIGGGGIYVPGSGGQTATAIIDKGLASIVFADGPAGLRIQRKYRIVDGEVQPISFTEKFADGFFNREDEKNDGEIWYQFCTAIPTGTTLAQTWDKKALRACGHLVAEEMVLYGITVWLAPGMNIHRDPLCGRNYEYFSEDPVLSAAMAASMTNGVQSIPGCYTTLKHMACNNAEDNRMLSDSIVPERALREIYLKGFELAVKECNPSALMTSYNKINGIHAANNYDLCTKIVRYEWGFNGIIITDWTTTQRSPECTASGCMYAGNDLVMPGSETDVENIKAALAKGDLDIADVKRNAARIVDLIWSSDWCSAEE